MLFKFGVANGMRGFENDFLNYNLLSVPYFRKVFDASSQWLRGMNAAALEHKLPIQMCMGLPSDLMASLELNAVTNYRASTDYALGGQNIDVGGSALLAFAVQAKTTVSLNLNCCGPILDRALFGFRSLTVLSGVRLAVWTERPESTIETGKPWGPKDNPGSNCELNAIIATLR